MKYLIGIAVIIGVGWYFISEPFSTKVDRAIDENSNWNPATILEDPDAYIYGALQHLDNLEKNLKEEKFRVNTRLNQMTREQETGERILSNLNDDIKRWKSDYKILDGRIEGVTQTKGYDKATAQQYLKVVANEWGRSFLTYQPEEVLPKLTMPVLALNGEKDLQVAAATNIGGMEAIFASSENEDVTLKILPDLNHLFQQAESGLPDEYGRINQTFAPQALLIISDWISSRVGE